MFLPQPQQPCRSVEPVLATKKNTFQIFSHITKVALENISFHGNRRISFEMSLYILTPMTLKPLINSPLG